MLQGKRFLAIVPARGGSKGVPRKNIKPLAGKPLLAYTLEAAGKVHEIDLVVVSTEDAEIKATAQSCGARVVDRPLELAADATRTEPVLLQVLDSLSAEAAFDYVIVLEPTSPLRTAATIRGCMEHILATGAESLLTVSETRANIGKLENGIFVPLVKGAPRRRQERQPFYVESSTVYVCRTGYLRETGTLVAEEWAAYVVSDEEATDINSPEDFRHAESLVSKKFGGAS